MQLGPEGNTNCWDGDFTFDRCCRSDEPVPRLPDSPDAYPACIVTGIVLRHLGEHGVFVDVTSHGSTGCFQNNCSHSDKFVAADPGVCARRCAEDGALRCFLRRSDGGRQWAKGWSAGTKACAPAPLPDAHAALAVRARASRPATGARARAVRTCSRRCARGCWRSGTSSARLAGAWTRSRCSTSTRLPPIHPIWWITGDYRPSDADFPRVVFNNRLIFNSLRDWLDSQAKAELGEQDLSLPVPLRTGGLCGGSCYEL
ncbi:unnamed protein product [Prorocentrum cordatum]|uniref:Uncharacterized protein n=1 Tax=Prorocentrum cordatum TaxID=2364126 RepID=A0ABN9TRV1_9DINO|nr:unnamed protein product [Polarella glacialis]